MQITNLVISGFNIVPDIYVSDTETVKRSWRERLFSKPWEPLTNTKQVYCPRIYVQNENTMIVSYQTYSILKGGEKLKDGVVFGDLLDVLRARLAIGEEP